MRRSSRASSINPCTHTLHPTNMTAVNFSSGVYELPPAFDEPPLSPIYTEDPLPVLNEATLRRKMEEKIRDEIRREIELKLRAEQEVRLAEQEVQRQLAEQKQKVQEEQKQIIELREIEEQVRAEIRREMEEKMRVEQEVQKQLAEQKKEREEQTQLIELHAQLQKVERIHERTVSVAHAFDKLIASGHTVLMWNNLGTGVMYPQYGLWMSQSCHLNGSQKIETGDIYILVTQKGVFRHMRARSTSRPDSPFLEEICPLYTFANPLNCDHSKILLSLSKAVHWHVMVAAARCSTTLWGGNNTHDQQYQYIIDHKKFESIIRLIPGSYSNGAWKQLDGFFGAYINEETMEIMGGAPPM